MLILHFLIIIIFAGISNVLANKNVSNNFVPIYFNETLVSKYYQNDSKTLELPVVHLSPITNDSINLVNNHNVSTNDSSIPILDNLKVATSISTNLPVTATTTTNSSNDSSNYLVINVKQSLELALKNIRNNELEIPTIQEIFDSMEFIPIVRNDMDIARNMSSKLSGKLTQGKRSLNEMCRYVMKNHKTRESAINPCPMGTKSTKNSFSSNQRYHAEILKLIPSNLTNSWTTPEASSNENDNFINQLFKDWSKKKKITLNYKYQYYITQEDVKIIGCSEKFDDLQFYKPYLSSIKNVAIITIIDIGKFINRNQFEMGVKIAHALTNLLNDDNFLHIAFLSNRITTIDKINSNSKKQIRNLGSTRSQLQQMIDDVQKSQEQTNHIIGFKHAFEMVQLVMNETSSEVPIVIFYVTQNLSSRNETQKILENIVRSQKGLPYPAVINTIQLIDGESSYIYVIFELMECNNYILIVILLNDNSFVYNLCEYKIFFKFKNELISKKFSNNYSLL